MRIEIASETAARQHLPRLNALLINNVDSGASIGWLPPMQAAAAEAYWQSRIPEIGAGSRVLLFAWEDETIVGSAQLGLEQRENGTHRAEVQKVMVHTDYRRRGIARQLMRALEDQAVQHKRSLLFLDTSEGDPAEQLYLAMGYTRLGEIPEYVINPDGSLHGTVIYYKILR